MIIGIDVGLSGGIAYYKPGSKDELIVVDMPTFQIERGGKKKRDIDIRQLSELLKPYRLASVYVEQVNSMPGQGVSSVFQFGKSYGVILGILAAHGISYTLVPPVRWKKALNVPASKDAARERASQLLPAHANKWKLVKNDGLAEASLIALYGYRQENNK